MFSTICNRVLNCNYILMMADFVANCVQLI